MASAIEDIVEEAKRDDRSFDPKRPAEAPAPEPAPEPEPEQEPEPEEPGWPEHLLAAAGLTAEQAQQQFGSPEKLEAALDWEDRQAQFAPAARPPLAAGPQVQPTAAPTAPIQPAPAAQEPPEAKTPLGFEYEPFEIPRRPDGQYEFDDATVELLKAQEEHAAKQFRRLAELVEQQLSQTQNLAQAAAQGQQAEAQRQYVEWFDNEIRALGPEWEEVFGKGTRDELWEANPNDVGLLNRRRLDATMAEIAQWRAANGLPQLTLRQTFHRALRRLWRDRLTSGRLESSNRGARAMRPTARRSSPKSDEERALAAVDAFKRRRGYGGITYGDEEELMGEI